jgi:hypothetical protein
LVGADPLIAGRQKYRNKARHWASSRCRRLPQGPSLSSDERLRRPRMLTFDTLRVLAADRAGRLRREAEEDGLHRRAAAQMSWPSGSRRATVRASRRLALRRGTHAPAA